MKLLIKIYLIACFLLPLTAFAKTSSEFYEEALQAYAKEDYETTYIQLKNSLQQDESNLSAKILMGKILMINTYMSEAQDELEEALALGGDPSLIVDTLGKVWLATKQYEKIIDSKFLALNKTAQTDWQIILAIAHINLNNLADARKEFQKALEIDPTNIRALNAIATLEMQENNFAKSKIYIDKSLMLEPENPASLRISGNFHLHQQNFDEAIADYEKSYLLNTSDPLTKRSLVTAYLQVQDIDSARDLLDKILQQTPEDPTAMLLKAWILAKEQRVEQAATELEALSVSMARIKREALEDRPALLYISALTAFALQNFQQAKSYFVQYLTLVPDNLEAVSLLAQTHIKLNQPKQAIEVVSRHEREMMNGVENAILIANLYLANDKAFKAVEISQQLQKQFPDHPEVKLLEIKTLMSRGKYQEALNLINASENRDLHERTIMAKAEILMELGKYNEVAQIADKLIELAPTNIDFLNLKAVNYMREQNFSKAISYLDRALAINSEHFEARFNKATILSARGEYLEAIKIADKLIEVEPDRLEVLSLLAGSHLNAGNFDEANARLERILQKDINNLFALESMAIMYARQGQPEKAIRQLNKAIKTVPENARYKMLRAELYLALKQTDRVTREIAEIKQLVANDPIGLANLVRLQLKANDKQGAAQTSSQAVELASDKLFIATEYIRAHLIAGDYLEARKMLSRWLAIKPDDPSLLVLSGDEHLANKDSKNAAEAYLKVLDVTGDHREAMLKSFQLAAQGIEQEAFEIKLVKLLKVNPDDYFARNLLADFYVNHGQLDNALVQYELLIQIDALPNKALILNNMANIYIDTDLLKAKQLIQQAIEEETEIAALYDTQGWILSLLGQHDEALTILRRAFSMNSDDPSTQYHLAYTLHKLDRGSQAKSALERALSSTRSFTERADAKALLLKL